MRNDVDRIAWCAVVFHSAFCILTSEFERPDEKGILECRMKNAECRMKNVEWRIWSTEGGMANAECRGYRAGLASGVL